MDEYEGYYLENIITFKTCETQIQDWSVSGIDTDLYQWVERFVQTAEYSQRWGLLDTCRYHTAFCADNPDTRQYESEQECIEYLQSLPLYTPACGKDRPLAGNSLPCKFKHHFMIAANPALHCAHIGKAGVEDINGDFKCDDAYECSQDDAGQDEWEPLVEIGPDVPPDRLALYNQSNIGYQDEPLGCAVPYAG